MNYKEVEFNEISNTYPELLWEDGANIIIEDTDSKWMSFAEFPEDFLLQLNEIEVDLMEELIYFYSRTVDYCSYSNFEPVVNSCFEFSYNSNTEHRKTNWFGDIVERLKGLLESYKDVISVNARNGVVSLVSEYAFREEDFFNPSLDEWY